MCESLRELEHQKPQTFQCCHKIHWQSFPDTVDIIYLSISQTLSEDLSFSKMFYISDFTILSGPYEKNPVVESTRYLTHVFPLPKSTFNDFLDIIPNRNKSQINLLTTCGIPI